MKRKDGLLLLAAALLILTAFAAARLWARGKAPIGTVRVYVDGALYAEVPLGQEQELVISQPDGAENVLTITADGFFMARSTCKNQLCVHQGQVTTGNYFQRPLGARVICLPNRVTAELTLTNQSPPPDAPDI